jgi:hypothetical protein
VSDGVSTYGLSDGQSGDVSDRFAVEDARRRELLRREISLMRCRICLGSFRETPRPSGLCSTCRRDPSGNRARAGRKGVHEAKRLARASQAYTRRGPARMPGASGKP